MANLSLTNLVKRYGDDEVLHDVNLEIEDGKFVVFLGPSGCGKTTLMRMIAGLEDITGGELKIDGQRVNDMPPAQRGIAMVFQSYALYPHMTLFDNMAFGLKLAHRPKAEIKAAVQHAAEILRIDHLLDRKPRQLSGGQRQRVAIGRAITRKPKVFLFDEPLSNLDAALRVQMRLEFSRLHQQLKTTMIYVTHDQTEAMTLADIIVILAAGIVEQVGSPDLIYHRPANRFVAAFIGSPKMNFLDGRVVQTNEQGVQVRFPNGQMQWAQVAPGPVQPDAAVSIGIRPEHLQISDGEGIAGDTLLVESLGDAAYLYAASALAPDGLIARIPALKRYAPGTPLKFTAKPHHCHLFDDKGKAFERRIDIDLRS